MSPTHCGTIMFANWELAEILLEYWVAGVVGVALILAVVLVRLSRRARPPRPDGAGANQIGATRCGVPAPKFIKRTFPPGVEHLEIVQGLCYSLAQRAGAFQTTDRQPPRVMILDLQDVPALQLIDLLALWEFFQECKARGIRLVLSGFVEEHATLLGNWRSADAFGRENICARLDQAMERAVTLLTMANEATPAPGRQTPTARNAPGVPIL